MDHIPDMRVFVAAARSSLWSHRSSRDSRKEGGTLSRARYRTAAVKGHMPRRDSVVNGNVAGYASKRRAL